LKLSEIVNVISGTHLSKGEDAMIEHLNTDSRKSFDTKKSLFFALSGPNHDGHDFIPELIKAGFQNFIVEKSIPFSVQNINLIKVTSSIAALQSVARRKREAFDSKVVGITGSNGKTIVKEWLAQLLSDHYSVCKSPKSYNSQIGVPLSVWQLSDNDELGIFEAGISMRNEMSKIKNIIQPTAGILTNIGSAHEEFFESIEQKLDEKLRLFEDCETLFYRNDNPIIRNAIKRMEKFPRRLISWGFNNSADLIVRARGNKIFEFTYQTEKFEMQLLSENESYVENIIHCICYAYFDGLKPSVIQNAINGLKPIKMRLELKKGANNTYVIDDTYNNDLAGLENALDFLAQQKQHAKKTLILSDILQSGSKISTYKKIASLIEEKGVNKVFAIGSEMKTFQDLFPKNSEFFESTLSFLEHSPKVFEKEVILIKGAREFGFERIVKQLVEKIHSTVLEINLDHLTHNLNVYRKQLNPKTKLLIMVKALGYGSGGAEIASLLEFHKVDYLGVAYVDEGVQLRKAGINLPIMVINPAEEDLDNLINYNIEPEIYSFSQLKSFSEFYLRKNVQLKGHFTINTGMNRLGFNPDSIDALVEQIKKLSHLKVQSIYTHLAAADDEAHVDFSLQQLETYRIAAEKIEHSLQITTLKHALNSAGITRFPNYQFDMVRLGIGLYGIEPNGILQKDLKPISTLKTIISQIRNLKKGESIGYGRKGIAETDIRIAVIAIGYADGFSRIFSNGNGEVLVNGKPAKVIGNVCMDMTMINISDIEAEEGDEVIVFGERPTISELALKAETIPYEILTNVSDRVKRVYYTE
jgi:alanine racemase